MRNLYQLTLFLGFACFCFFASNMQHKVSEKRTPILVDSYLETQNSLEGFLLNNMEDIWSGNVPHPLCEVQIFHRLNINFEFKTQQIPNIKPLKSSFLMLDIPPPEAAAFLA